jgi:hypothetical protein
MSPKYGPGDPRGVYARYSNPDEPPAPYTINGKVVDTNPGWAEPRPVAPVPTQPETVVSQAYSGLQQVRQAHQRHLEEVYRNADRLSEEGRRDAIADFRNSQAAKLLDQIDAAADQRLAQAQNDYAQQLKGLTQPGDAAQETRNSRTWDRELRKLEAAKDSGSVINVARQALESSSGAELGVLMEQMPSYLESRKVPTEWINPVVTQQHPALGEAQWKANQAQQAATLLHYNAMRIRNGIHNGSPPNYLVDPSKFDPDIPTQ